MKEDPKGREKAIWNPAHCNRHLRLILLAMTASQAAAGDHAKTAGKILPSAGTAAAIASPGSATCPAAWL